MNNTVKTFLQKHNFPLDINPNKTIDLILSDMNDGLLGKKSDLDMVKTFSLPPENPPKNESVIVIDAGGTNFRSCIVTFDENGNSSISDVQKTKMPGVEKELSKIEFFDEIANNVEHLKDKSNKIGFCFSYPMTITDDKDGILINFAKEIKANEVVGCKIGEELKSVLKKHGWKNELSVVLMNDTVCALLAGQSDIPSGVEFSSYIGFILGTGLNVAYIQNEEYEGVKKQIIVTEGGKFCDVIVSDFDKDLDTNSKEVGKSLLEKQCSGAYIGPLCLYALKHAAKDKIFSDKLCDEISNIEKLTLVDVDLYMHKTYDVSNWFTKLVHENGSTEDVKSVFEIIDAIMNRDAILSACLVSACVLQSKEGKDPTRSVCILCDGTTFHKTYKIKQRFFSVLEEVLWKQNGVNFLLVSKDNDITLGAAIGGLI